jgi:hypothetical protein
MDNLCGLGKVTDCADCADFGPGAPSISIGNSAKTGWDLSLQVTWLFADGESRARPI